MLRRMKISHQLFLLVGISLLFIALLQVMFLSYFYRVFRTNLESNTTNILRQLEENMTQSAAAIQQSAEVLAYDTMVQNFMNTDDYYRRAEMNRYIRSLFDSLITANPNIREIILRDAENRYVGYRTTADITLAELDALHNPATSQSGQGTFYLIESSLGTQYLYVLPFSLFRDWNAMGHCYVVFGNSSFSQMLQSIDLPAESVLYLTNASGHVLASNQNEDAYELDGDLQTMLDGMSGTATIEYQGRNALLKKHEIPSMGWTLVSIIPSQELLRPINNLIFFGIAATLIIVLCLLLFSTAIIRSINASIRRLSDFMQDITYQSLGKRIEVSQGNEISQMSLAVNTMLEQLQSLTRQIFTSQSALYEMDIAKKEAELSALQSQINPHFLYNTLDCIRVIAYSYGAQEIVSIASAMAQVFRYSTRHETMVPIAEEIACIDHYIEIIQIRHENRFSVEMHIDEDILPMKMVKFLLQPLVENAIYHGLEMKQGPGHLWIRGTRADESSIVFVIRDDGAGMPAEKLRFLEEMLENGTQNESGSIALLNIHRRLRIPYGKPYGLSIQSEEGVYCEVSVHMPVL